PMPAEQDVKPEDLDDLWDCCFLLHVKDLDKPDYIYTYLGDHITESLTGMGQVKELTKGYTQVIKHAKPVVEEGEFPHPEGVVKYRQCLVPLGEGGEVQAILGGVRFKVFS
ncbi:MAG: hypothetical protein K2Q01_09090, partial [Rickettsiales bacterium]|nr:hypothetical protein [Rickettsiales bacterium]